MPKSMCSPVCATVQRLLRPGALPPVVAAEELAHADGRHAKRENGVLLGVADRDHARGPSRDLSGAELVLDGDGETAGARALGRAPGVVVAAGAERARGGEPNHQSGGPHDRVHPEISLSVSTS
ncbi:MAG: hypothetical protein ACRDLD_12670, partial [Thermoleophilaceae bacterium]